MRSLCAREQHTRPGVPSRKGAPKARVPPNRHLTAGPAGHQHEYTQALISKLITYNLAVCFHNSKVLSFKNSCRGLGRGVDAAGRCGEPAAAVSVTVERVRSSESGSLVLLVRVQSSNAADNASCSYSGPDSQLVTHRLRLSWLHYLASVEGFAVASADVAGSAGRGRSFAFQLYRKLGNVEVGAQVAALKWVPQTSEFPCLPSHSLSCLPLADSVT